MPQPVHFSLLANPHEKRLLQYHTTGQVVLIDVRTRALKTVGAPAMVRNVDASHDGQFLRVTRMTEPFSYLVTVSSFGGVQELWDASGKVVATLARTPLRESGRDGGDAAPAVAAASDTGKRNMQWNPIGPGLLYVQNVPAPAAPATPPVNGRSGAKPTTVWARGAKVSATGSHAARGIGSGRARTDVLSRAGAGAGKRTFRLL